MKEPIRVIVKRREALGDTILTTPFLRHLKQFYRVHLISNHTKALKDSYDTCGPLEDGEIKETDIVVDLNLAYESRPTMHMLRAYEEVFKSHNLPTPDLTKTGPLVSSEDFNGEEWIIGQKYAVFHWGITWKAKMISKEIMNDLASYFIKYHGLKIAVVGAGNDWTTKLCKYDLRGKLNLNQTRKVIDNAVIYVGIDSAPYHVASSTLTDQVGLFTVVDGELVKPLHKKNNLVINTPVSCMGCLKRLPAPVETHWCTSEKPFHCVNSFNADQIYQQVLQNGFLSSVPRL